MKMRLLIVIFICISKCSLAQLYYPPITGATWETINPTSLGWCDDKIDSLYNFLEENNSKAFIILKDGKIVLEKYYGSFNQDSAWYWASAGKSLTSFLVGIAQKENLLNINDTVSKFLGNNWTSLSAEKERKIKVVHQLSMNSGLKDNVTNPDCTLPSCLIYEADAGDRWAYHNAPYHLIHDVIDSASGLNINQFTNQKLAIQTGIFGLWNDHVFYSKPRVMARFGLLMLGKGNWNNNPIISDTNYFHSMIHSSQTINNAYGYLWWLNGQQSYMLPSVQFQFQGSLCPNAPDDMYAALGKNDQKIYVVPSQNMVVIRMGNKAAEIAPALSEFDNVLWEKINELDCTTSIKTENINQNDVKIYPNPSSNYFNIESKEKINWIKIYDLNGKIVHQTSNTNNVEVNNLSQGLYVVELISDVNKSIKRLKLIID